MKITHNKIGQNINLSDSGRADKSKENSTAKTTAAAVQSDTKTEKAQSLKELSSSNKNDSVKVDLSERAQDIRKAKEMAMATPDVDMEKVEKFRKLIDEGKYKVDAKSVADRMVNEGLLNLGRTDNE